MKINYNKLIVVSGLLADGYLLTTNLWILAIILAMLKIPYLVTEW